MRELLFFLAIVVITGMTYLYYRLSTRKRMREYMNTYGINMKDREILDEVWQFFRFIRKIENKTNTMKKVLFLGLLEVLILLIGNIICILILINLFNR